MHPAEDRDALEVDDAPEERVSRRQGPRAGLLEHASLLSAEEIPDRDGNTRRHVLDFPDGEPGSRLRLEPASFGFGETSRR